MTIEYLNDETQVRASDGSLERIIPREEDPTEKSLLVLIEERAGRATPVVPADIVDPREGHSSKLDEADDGHDQCGLDRTMLRLGGNGF